MRNFSIVFLSALAAFLASPAWATCTPTTCQVPENVMMHLPFTAIAGDVIIQEASSTTVSDVFRVFNNLVDTGSGTGLGNMAILYSGDDTNPLPDPSTYSANATIIKEAASGSTSYNGNGTNYVLDTSAVATKLVYTGDTAVDYHDPAQLTAVLTVVGTSAPVAGATVNLTLGSQSCSGTTDPSGIASCSIVLTQVPGNYTVAAAFSGIFGADAATSVSRPFSITLEETTLSYTGDLVIANGGAAHLSGVLLEDGTTPIAGRTVSFKLGTGATAQTCNGTTDPTGKAVCTISPVAQPLGSVAVADSFAGDAFYRPASATANTIQFTFPSSGAFVLGDGSAGMGTHATFWGDQWAADNHLSGGGAPSSFKGFADDLSSEPPVCGVHWTTRPGNSSHPPGSIPTYMGVLVSSGIGKSGPSLSGTGARIVVVQVSPGYDGNPGHAGTGTVVAEVCH